MKKRKPIICVLLCLGIALCIPSRSQALSLNEITSDSIKEKENQISSAQTEKQSLQANLSDVKKIKKELEAVKSNLSAYVTQLDAR